jgi:Zn finger protein HypA/HybF involved in hydrogenase expression
MPKRPKQTEEVWKSDIRVNERLSVVLDSFTQSHGADSSLLETMTCQACGSTCSAGEHNPDDYRDINCPICHSHDVIITEVRLFTNVEGV